MHEQGFPMTLICKETGLSMNIVRNRLGKTGAIASGKKRGFQSWKEKMKKQGKYDYKFEEKICQGKMYSDYIKK